MPVASARRVALLSIVACVVLYTYSGAIRAEDAGTLAPAESRRAVAEGNATLFAKPPRRDDARHAFDRAIAAGDLPAAVSEAHLRLAALDEEDGEFARALEHYQACSAALSSSRWAHSARLRVTWLNARSDGDFAPLARLQRMQRASSGAADPQAIEAFAREAEAFPPGLVRADARMLVGEAWLKRLNRRAEGIAELRKVVDDPRTNPLDAAAVERDIVEALLADGRLDEAAGEIQKHSYDPQMASDVRRMLRRRFLRRCAAAALAAFAMIAAFGAARAVRRGGKRALRDMLPTRKSLVRLLIVASAIAGGVVLASYDGVSISTYLLVGLVTVMLLALVERAWGSAASWRSAASIVWTLACCSTALATALLVVDAIDPAYIVRLGLLGK